MGSGTWRFSKLSFMINLEHYSFNGTSQLIIFFSIRYDSKLAELEYLKKGSHKSDSDRFRLVNLVQSSSALLYSTYGFPRYPDVSPFTKYFRIMTVSYAAVQISLHLFELQVPHDMSSENRLTSVFPLSIMDQNLTASICAKHGSLLRHAATCFHFFSSLILQKDTTLLFQVFPAVFEP